MPSDDKPAARRSSKAAPNAEAIARALACKPSALRDAVIANLEAGAYARLDDIETELASIEK